MNVARLLIPMLVLLLTFSCSNEDENNVVGLWVLSQYRVDCPANPSESIDFMPSNGCYTFDGTKSCFSIDLKSDGTGTVMISIDDETDMNEITYMSSDTGLTLCYGTNDCETFQLAGGQLSAVYEDDGCQEKYVFTKS